MQKRAAPVVLDGDDCIIQSETGSGKTLAFLLPALSLLGYPPTLYPDDLKASCGGIAQGLGRKGGCHSGRYSPGRQRRGSSGRDAATCPCLPGCRP